MMTPNKLMNLTLPTEDGGTLTTRVIPINLEERTAVAFAETGQIKLVKEDWTLDMEEAPEAEQFLTPEEAEVIMSLFSHIMKTNNEDGDDEELIVVHNAAERFLKHRTFRDARILYGYGKWVNTHYPGSLEYNLLAHAVPTLQPQITEYTGGTTDE